MADMKEIHDFLEECNAASGAFYLVTINGDKPACRPVGLHMLVEGIEYFGVGTFKDVYRQIEANQNIQIVGTKGADWIRISGTAVIDDDQSLVDQALEENPFLKNIYNEETGNELGIFHIENGTAQFYEQLMTLSKTEEF